MKESVPDTLIRIAEGDLGKHEDGSSNTAAWLDPIERKAIGMTGQAWCAIIAFWRWIPATEEATGVKSRLIPCAGVRRGARLNKAFLHPDPKVGDIGYLGHVGSEMGHQVLVSALGKDSNGSYYLTVEGNTKADDPKSRNGGEVATHRRYRGHHDGFEELGFASPF